MQVKSFAYLKKSNSCMPKTREKEDEAKNTEKSSENHNNICLKEKTLNSPKKEKTLMGSRFCYGCLRFSVNYPDTDLEMGFCQRIDPKDGKTVFKVIQPEYLIRRCPGKVLK